MTFEVLSVKNAKIENLEAEVEALRAKLEEVTKERDAAQQREAELRRQLDQLLAALKSLRKYTCNAYSESSCNEALAIADVLLSSIDSALASSMKEVPHEQNKTPRN